ncbi:MAG TPA: hypothetical protein VFT72_16890 [Opitutaceae bacterium]|nr:hypothetical protein [Opitutaceae bacterium]
MHKLRVCRRKFISGASRRLAHLGGKTAAKVLAGQADVTFVPTLSKNLKQFLREFRSSAPRTKEELWNRVQLHVFEYRIRKQLPALAGGLEQTCGTISELIGEIEARFLECGRALRRQAELTGRLNLQCETLRKLAPHEGRSTAFDRVAELIGEHLSLGETFAHEVEQLAQILEQHAVELQQLLKEQDVLERAFAPMRVLQSFFRIESAGLSVEMQSLFQAVTVEMQRLQAEFATNFTENAEALQKTRADVLSTAAQLRRQASHHLEITRQKREEFMVSRTKLEDGRESSVRREEALARAIKELNQQIDSVTFGLQFQDITRQKMEHIQTAGREVLQKLGARSDAAFRTTVHQNGMLCRVQVGQLSAVQDDLERATSTITGGLQAVIAELKSVERDSLSMDELTRITQEMDALVSETGKTHRLTSDLMRSSAAGLSEAIRASRGFANATTGATDAMRRLAADIQMMGLNAQVQAVQANNGSLEVLSGAASEISRDAANHSQDFQEKLVRATEALNQLIQQSERVCQRMQSAYADLTSRDTTVFRELEDEVGKNKSALQTMGSLFQEMKREADALVEVVDLANVSREPLEIAKAAFTALGEFCLAHTAREQAKNDAAVAEALNRYTMDSERAVHQAAVAAASTAPTAPAEIPAPASDAVSASAEASAPAEAPKPTSDLGDNVELF